MSKIKIKQIHSGIKCSLRQKRTLQALGFKKLYQTIEIDDTLQIRGMIEKVKHLVRIVSD